MGTTLVTAARRGDELAVAWVGDSRAYLLEGDQLRSLTNDHNVAEEMLALGMIDAEQARTHPGQYRLTRALSGDSDIDATPDALTVPARGRLLLCSDGLNGELSSDTIGRLLGEADPETAARALVHAALDAGAGTTSPSWSWICDAQGHPARGARRRARRVRPDPAGRPAVHAAGDPPR